MNKTLILISLALAATGCGLSETEMATAKKHATEIAEQQCKCDQLKTQQDKKAAEYSECVREFERRVKYQKMFYDVVKPSDKERKTAAAAGEAVTAACKK